MKFTQRTAVAMFRAQLTMLQRERASWMTLGFFSALVVLILHFAAPEEPAARLHFAPHAVWLATLFGAVLHIGRTYEHERDERVLEGLATLPRAVNALFFSKLVINLFVVNSLAIWNILLASLFFRLPWSLGLALFLPIAAGSIGLCSLGTGLALLVRAHSKRDLLFPVIFFPLIAPFVIALSQLYGDASMPAQSDVWMRLIAAGGALFCAAVFLLYRALLKGSA